MIAIRKTLLGAIGLATLGLTVVAAEPPPTTVTAPPVYRTPCACRSCRRLDTHGRSPARKSPQGRQDAAQRAGIDIARDPQLDPARQLHLNETRGWCRGGRLGRWWCGQGWRFRRSRHRDKPRQLAAAELPAPGIKLAAADPMHPAGQRW